MKGSVLVTGASRGIGRAVGEELSRRGWRVFGGARSWPAGETPGFAPLPLDVTDERSAAAAVAAVVKAAGRLDALVNNAGVSHAGSIEETSLETARRVFETNYLGLVTMTRAALPGMRKQGGGLIANVGSAAGKIGVPFQAHYAASKFAVEGLSEALCLETRRFGIRVILIEPGDVATAIWRDNERAIPPGSPYAAQLENFFRVKDREMGGRATPPAVAAAEIAAAIESGSSRLRWPVARMAGLLLLARKLLPDSAFLGAVARNYGLK